MRQQMEEEQWDLCRLLDAALHLKIADKYDRFHSPHLRPSQIVRPR